MSAIISWLKVAKANKVASLAADLTKQEIKEIKEKLLKESVEEVVEKSKKETKEKLDEVTSNAIKKTGNEIGVYGGKILNKSEIKYWTKLLKKNYGTKLKKVDSFDNPKDIARFNPNTNTIEFKDDITNYIMFHESMHAEEFFKLGFSKYVENAHIIGTPWTPKNRIHNYFREKYVYEKIQEHTKIQKFNSEELFHSFIYFDTTKAKLEKLLLDLGIPFPNY